MKKIMPRRIPNIIVNELELKPDEPIKQNARILTLSEATGSIGEQTFSLLPQLQSLTITRSRIAHIEDGVLGSLPSLERIVFEDNEEFPVITAALLRNCEKVRRLSLKNVQMEPGAFRHLVNLDWLQLMNQNNFNLTKENLEPFKNLETIELVDCEIKQIEAGALGQSPRLSNIYMTGNSIPSPLSKKVFENCYNVRLITFRSRNHVDVEEGAFSDFTTIDQASFKYLNTNRLTRKTLSGLNNASYIEFSNSKIENVDADAFTGFKRLAHLHLEDNKLTRVNFDTDLTNVITLYINGNAFTEFNSDDVLHLPNLARLVLSNNKLTSIDNIRHPVLDALLVDGNNISQINAESLKANLPNLKVLSIGKNSMSTEYVNDLKRKLEGIEFDG